MWLNSWTVSALHRARRLFADALLCLFKFAREAKCATRLFVYCLGILGTVSWAQEGPTIFQIFDQFVISRGVAFQCAKPNSATVDAHATNFLTVSTRVLEELQKRNPKRSKQETLNGISNRAQEITSRVNALVGERGCADAELQMLVKRFFVQATWQPGK